MSDLVVTVPKDIWADWIDEGDAVGEPDAGVEWSFLLGGGRPRIEPGERLYVVAWGMLRGYAPVTRVMQTERGWAICRRGGAVAVTIAEPVRGFRGWRERWWDRETETPFQDWQTAGLTPRERNWVKYMAMKRRKLDEWRARNASARPVDER